jgi:hypothetical protein
MISCSYFFFSCSFGVHGTNITLSAPPRLYHVLFFSSFSSFLSVRLQYFGRCMGLTGLQNIFSFPVPQLWETLSFPLRVMCKSTGAMRLYMSEASLYQLGLGAL